MPSKRPRAQHNPLKVLCLLAVVSLVALNERPVAHAQAEDVVQLFYRGIQAAAPQLRLIAGVAIFDILKSAVTEGMKRGFQQLPDLAEYVKGIVIEKMKQASSAPPTMDPASTATFGDVQKAFAQIFDYQQVIQFDSFRQIGTDGFVVKTNIDPAWVPLLDHFGNKLRRAVSLVGACDVGKTYLGSKLCGVQYDQGFNVSTNAISMMRPLWGSSSILFDSSGQNQRATYDQLYDRSVTDAFIEETLLGISDVIIYVVNTMRASDQHTLRRILHRIRGTNKEVIVVHNFRGLLTVPLVEQHIKEHIETAFGASFQDHSGGFYQSFHEEFDKFLRHVVLAEDGSDAGNHYNENTFKTLHNLIDAVETVAARDMDIVKAVMSQIRAVLPNFFFPSSNTASPSGIRDDAELEMHQDTNKVTQLLWSSWRKVKQLVTGRVSESDARQPAAESVPATSPASHSDPFEIVLEPLPSGRIVSGCSSHNGDSNPTDQESAEPAAASTGMAFSCQIIRLKDPRELKFIPKNNVKAPPSIFPDARSSEIMHTTRSHWKLIIDAPGLSSHHVRANAGILRVELDKPRPDIYTAKSKNCDGGDASSACYAYDFEKSERRFSKMVLQFRIPANIDPSKITKKYHNNGFLEITGLAFSKRTAAVT